jgi:hypothetical protein
MATVSRQIATVDVARIRETLAASGVRYAIQIDDEITTLIFLGSEASAAADAIAKELTR